MFFPTCGFFFFFLQSLFFFFLLQLAYANPEQRTEKTERQTNKISSFSIAYVSLVTLSYSEIHDITAMNSLFKCKGWEITKSSVLHGCAFHLRVFRILSLMLSFLSTNRKQKSLFIFGYFLFFNSFFLLFV